MVRALKRGVVLLVLGQLLPPRGMLLVQGVSTTTSFSSLTLVGERWNNGQWQRLNPNGTIVGNFELPMLQRGDPGAELIISPRQSPGLLALSASMVLCSANDTTQISTDGGRSWERSPGHDVQLPPSIPAPEWMKQLDPGARCRAHTSRPHRPTWTVDGGPQFLTMLAVCRRGVYGRPAY